MFNIENEYLKVGIISTGAELQSIFSKETQLEYLWNGDPAFWSKRSPVLFPIIGTLKNDFFKFEEIRYKLSRHGFAREQEFTVAEQGTDRITFTVLSNEITLAIYPFKFRLDISYRLNEKKLSVTYRVRNIDSKDIYFSIGGHPAFKLPIVPGVSYEDYYLEFNKIENASRWLIVQGGLIGEESTKLLDNTNKMLLKKELFYIDAIVFKHLKSDTVRLLSDKSPHGLEFNFPGFPFLGIWAAKNADFVCIEPWCGIADSVDSNNELKEKEGINKLGVAESFEKEWSVSLF